MAATFEREYVSHNGVWVPFVSLPPEELQPPTNFMVWTDDANNVVGWSDSVSDGVDGYDIYWSPTGLEDWTTGTLLGSYAPGVQTATHVGGQDLGDIYYAITARRDDETSSWQVAYMQVPYAVYYDWGFAENADGWDISGDSRNTFTWYPGHIQWLHSPGSLGAFGYLYCPPLEKGDQVGEGCVYGSSYYLTADFQLISNAITTEFPVVSGNLYLGGSLDDAATSWSPDSTFTHIGQIVSVTSVSDPGVMPSDNFNIPRLQLCFTPAHDNGYQACEVHLLRATIHNMDGTPVYHMVYPRGLRVAGTDRPQPPRRVK